MNRASLLLLISLFPLSAFGGSQTEDAFTSIVFNYWCQKGVPPESRNDLSLVVDLNELEKFLDFDPDEWINSVRFETDGEKQIIKGPELKAGEVGNVSKSKWSSTHVCNGSKET